MPSRQFLRFACAVHGRPRAAARWGSAPVAVTSRPSRSNTATRRSMSSPSLNASNSVSSGADDRLRSWTALTTVSVRSMPSSVRVTLSASTRDRLSTRVRASATSRSRSPAICTTTVAVSAAASNSHSSTYGHRILAIDTERGTLIGAYDRQLPCQRSNHFRISVLLAPFWSSPRRCDTRRGTMVEPAAAAAKRESSDRLAAQDHLRAPEERDRTSIGMARDDGVPDLRRAAEMRGLRDAGDRAVARRAQEIALELDGREVVGAFGQVRDAAVAACRIGERDHGRRVQEAVRREQFGADVELGDEHPLLDRHDAEADKPGQPADAALAHRFERDVGSKRHSKAPRHSREGGNPVSCDERHGVPAFAGTTNSYSRSPTHAGTDCNALGNCAGSLPPACAMSGRPPPLPPTCCAT